jgi:hypothetical protein
VSDKPSRDYANPDKSYKDLKVAKLHQAGGFRIDFFGGSEFETPFGIAFGSVWNDRLLVRG